ncbi:MAG: hypothetical protein QOE92_844 [Chloroflexota bacterium]|jgi:hypothetical protein|nr:hypothetical protein [Chloroflexota bacterium]
MRVRKFALIAAVCAATAAIGGASAPLGAVAATWAPAKTAAIHPGVQTFTAGAQCTSNFVFTDGSATYIGQAAHCSGTGGSFATNGCNSGTLPVGTAVQVTGASRLGTMVYNSWATMQSVGESDANTCQYNDLALVRLDPADVGRVNPSVPYFGGPTGLRSGAVGFKQKVFSYGNSELRFGVAKLSPKRGVILSEGAGGWTHTVYTATPGIPGDSGSGFLDKDGRAFGVLSTISAAGGTNGVGDLGYELNYLASHTSFRVSLALGTEPFSPL